MQDGQVGDTQTGDMFQRTEMLLGRGAMSAIERCRVALIGVGGVGSWCAEALVRSGVGCLTIVDPDRVVSSNRNRQLAAMRSTLGRSKADVMRERLLDINPSATITALAGRYTEETAESLRLVDYDFVVDAIDTVADKAHLILYVTRLTAQFGAPRLLSSMGAGRRVDPTQVRVANFWQVKGDPLACSLRKRLRRAGTLPSVPFQCVYSLEPPRGVIAASTGENAGVNASFCPVTATFGMALAAELLLACGVDTSATLR